MNNREHEAERQFRERIDKMQKNSKQEQRGGSPAVIRTEDVYDRTEYGLSRSDVHKALKQSKDLEKTLAAVAEEVLRHDCVIAQALQQHEEKIRAILEDAIK